MNGDVHWPKKIDSERGKPSDLIWLIASSKLDSELMLSVEKNAFLCNGIAPLISDSRAISKESVDTYTASIFFACLQASTSLDISVRLSINCKFLCGIPFDPPLANMIAVADTQLILRRFCQNTHIYVR